MKEWPQILVNKESFGHKTFILSQPYGLLKAKNLIKKVVKEYALIKEM